MPNAFSAGELTRKKETQVSEPLADVFADIVGRDAPVRFEAYDGSASGSSDAEVRIRVTSPLAIDYVVSSPGELGLARAYVTGGLVIDGDVYSALRLLADSVGTLSPRQRLEVLRALGIEHLKLVQPPPEEARSRGLIRHSKGRDAKAISHHYDVSNAFYEYVLGPSMAYTCAVFPREDATLEEAQDAKHDLVCRKLGLEPGMRLLDVGCGWGGMVRHAAKHYGVTAVGVTLSRQQAEWAQKAIADQGLSGVAEVRHSDYRDVRESGFDAVSSIGLTEHIGKRNLPAYFTFLASRLRDEGRLLNHCITRPTTRERAGAGKFIDRYVFPDGELEGVGTIVSAMQDHGFEVRHEENLREHYAKTLTGWCDNLTANWDAAVAEAGIGRARVWALYMAGSRLGFERRTIELHQVLGVKVAPDGTSGMPLRPTW
jgi:cyclopropane-fatty-acyl-phospholipid synthase